jgi:hypothetical protein
MAALKESIAQAKKPPQRAPAASGQAAKSRRAKG